MSKSSTGRRIESALQHLGIKCGTPTEPMPARARRRRATISATPAIVNAIRNATGLNPTHTPVTPERIAVA
ncbi:hypothetical protein ACWD0A_06825 [Streptomyces sp. NPDC002867]